MKWGLHKQGTHLFNRNSRFPALFLVENGEADRARWVDIGMEQWWRELACDNNSDINDETSMAQLQTFRWLGGII